MANQYDGTSRVPLQVASQLLQQDPLATIVHARIIRWKHDIWQPDRRDHCRLDTGDRSRGGSFTAAVTRMRSNGDGLRLFGVVRRIKLDSGAVELVAIYGTFRRTERCRLNRAAAFSVKAGRECRGLSNP